MKVVHLSTLDFGGAGNAAYRLHKGLQLIGVDSTFIVLDKKSGDPSVKVMPDYVLHSPSNCTTPERYMSERMKTTWGNWSEKLKEYPGRPNGLEIFTDTESSVRLDVIKEISKADIINLHWVAGMINYDGLPAWLKGKQVVWTLHDMNAFTGGCHYTAGCEKYQSMCGACPHLGSSFEKDLANRNYNIKKSAYENLKINVVTPSRWLGEEAKRSSLFSKFPVDVIPYGLHIDTYKPFDRAVAKSMAKIDKNTRVILFGAESVENKRKGLDYLIESLHYLDKEELQDVLVITFGSGKIPFPQIANLKFHSLGSISDQNLLSAIYSLADVFVIPSLEDNLPNTVLESLACGTPVVAFNIGGIPDMVGHMKTGYLAEPKNTRDLANGINWVLSNTNQAEISKLCRKTAEEKYGLKKQAEAYLMKYNMLLNEEKFQSDKVIKTKKPEIEPALDSDEYHSKKLPKISVITPSFNQAAFIEQTIQSVLAQNYANFEHIIIDGGSTDRTIEILKKYPHLKWVSEKDNGQSEAINKGLKLADGEIIAWINSDDWYERNTFLTIARYFERNQNKNIVMGNCNLVDENGNIFDCVINYERGFEELKNYLVPRSIPTQPAIFFREKLLKESGLLDINLKYTMDYDLWMRFARKDRFYHINQTFANYRFHKEAKIGDENWGKIYPECEKVRLKYDVVKKDPLISVIIACYNYGKYLPIAVESVINQTYKNYEIIIVNDGSTDNSLKVARELISQYKDYKIRVLKTKNLGPTNARIKGFSNAKGEFLLSLDADDKIAPTYLEETLPVLLNDPSLGYVYVDVQTFGDSNRLHRQFEYNFSRMTRENYIAYCSLIRKKAYDEVGGFDRNYWGGAEDWELWINLGSKGWHGKHLPRTLFFYNEHFQTSVTKSTSRLLPFIKAYFINQFPSLYSEKQRLEAEELSKQMPPNWQAKPMKGIKNLEELHNQYPDNQHILFFLAESYFEEKLYVESFDCLKRLHSLYPNDNEANLLLQKLNSKVQDKECKIENGKYSKPEQNKYTTVFILTVGDITFDNCKKAIEAQEANNFTVDIIRNISPFSKAAQEMITRCKTEYFIQIDEDMILDPDAVQKMESAIKLAPANVGMICFHLYDVDREMKIQGVKIYSTNLMKDITFHDIKASEMNILEQMQKKDIQWQLRDEVIGKHGTLYTPESIYLRYKSMYEKDIRAWNIYTWDLRKKVEKFIATNDINQLFAVLGAAHGIINAPNAEDKEKDFTAYNDKAIEVFKNLLLSEPELATKYKLDEVNVEKNNKTVSSKKKILIACTHFWPSSGGVESITEDLGNNLVNLAFSVDVATIGRNDRTSNTYRGMNIISLDSSGAIQNNIPKWAVELRSLVLTGEYSCCILLADPLNHIIWSLFNADIPANTRVIIQPVINQDGFEKWKNNSEFRKNLSSILKRSSIVSMSKKGPDTRFFNEESLPYTYIPNASTYTRAESDFRLKYNIPEDAVLILHVANLWPVKNHPAILEEFKDKPDNWVLALIGYPSTDLQYVNKVKSEIEKSNNVIYIPGLPKDEISNAMESSDFIILASKAEGSPITILEAMCQGKPWIATPSCGSINENAGGIIAPLNKFKLAIKFLLDNTALTKELSRLGKKHWQNTYNWSKVIRAWEEVILTGMTNYNFGIDKAISDRTDSIKKEWENYLKSGAADFKPGTNLENSLAKEMDDYSLAKEVLDKNPLVSVIIPTYNRKDKLKNAIKSVLSQSYKNLEVIIVNDAGQDVKKIINQLDDNRIKLVDHSKNKGLAAARNTGIKNANGKYVALLDDDDMFYKNHLSMSLKILSDKIKVVYTDAVRISFEKSKGIERQVNKSVPYSIEFDRDKLLIGNIAPVNCFVFEKSLVEEAGLFDETLPVLEDWDFWIKLSFFTEFKHIKENTVQVNWYNDGSTMSSSKGKDFEETRKKIYKKYETEINKIKNVGEIAEEFNSIWEKDKNTSASLVSIIALSYNQLSYTKTFVESVLKYTSVPFELILVDNASNKETVDYLRSLSLRDKRIKLILNTENFGFPKGVNQAIKAAQGNYILIANNDIVVTEGWLERLIEVAVNSSQIGLVGPISNVVSGVQLDKEAKYKNIKDMHSYATEIKRKNQGKTFQFPRLAFLCTLIKKEVIEKIGGLDERFSPGNFEDDDFCLRAQIAGFKTVVAQDIFIHHFGSKSFTADGTKKYAERLEINKKIFIEKWGADPEEIWLQGKAYKNRSVIYPLEDDISSEAVQRAQVCIKDKEYGFALHHLQNVLNNSSADFNKRQIKIDSLFHLAGKICLIERKFDEAVNYFNKELDNNLGSLRAYKGLGDAYTALGQKEKAVKMYQKQSGQKVFSEFAEL